MYRFSNILFVPLAKRDNPAAVRRVADLADKNDARLTVLGVVAEPSRLQRLLDQPLIDQAVRDAEQHALTERLETCCTELGLHRTEHVVRSGNSPLVIVREVLKAGHDLVVVTSDEDREDHATIKRVLRKCPCPVWVIRPTRAKVQRVLAAVNPIPEEEELNHQILELASSMTELYGGELHVVHAWELQGETTMRNSAFIHTSPGDIDRMLADAQHRHREALEELIAKTGIEAEWNVHLMKGRAADAIVELAARKRINALVMGTVARTGVVGLLVGNTAEQLLDDVRCSLLAVKPPGFVSPVTPE
ncbi:MAG: universal stress protein [Acidimicrobiia bacterium]|nr:universal stress protein [Acidimicrobiia bacterium]